MNSILFGLPLFLCKKKILTKKQIGNVKDFDVLRIVFLKKKSTFAKK